MYVLIKDDTGKVSISSDYDKCGTELITGDSQITLKNSLKYLTGDFSHPVIKLKPTHILDVTCSYFSSFSAKGNDIILIKLNIFFNLIA